jgi:YggT family protein
VLGFLTNVIDLFSRLVLLIVIAYVFMGYFMDPYHPLRRSLGRLIEPFLAPIRRIVPPVGMFDLSPLILIILLQVLSQVLIRLLVAIF